MPRKLVVSLKALSDIQIGVDYYKVQQKALGRRFEKLVQATFAEIREMPYSASFSNDEVRYKVMKKFPYIILYEFDDANIYILRVFNTHLSPERI